ncbi:ABC transporter ATP-binding protein [Microlunatus elymi]|uniref:ABC transporter ATP-binding protein n=2 Tax=Microlunatus elymi TaxID=2596828 RepID=A0A516Q598_9ACTN|nr:ABC transporter ATP-binding protein [Microlunatus elymi]
MAPNQDSRSADPRSVAAGSPATGAPDRQPLPALDLRGLQKSFGAKQAVRGLQLQVMPGRLFGLVGPNGAGKTTTLSMATGLLRPDAGSALILGHDVWTDPPAAKALMGVLPDGVRLFDRLSGRELLRYIGRLRQVPEDDIEIRSSELLAALGLTDDADQLVVDYSAGMTKKIGLACALIHAPRLLILDEPFEAVDPVSGEGIRSILRGYVASGGTVVMSSHVMELVENLCDSVAVVAAGQVLAAGSLDEVRAGMSLQQRFLQLVGGAGNVAVQQGGEEVLSWLRSSSV